MHTPVQMMAEGKKILGVGKKEANTGQVPYGGWKP
jgi:hypothetical protein